jgi:hypothetical protein
MRIACQVVYSDFRNLFYASGSFGLAKKDFLKHFRKGVSFILRHF